MKEVVFKAAELKKHFGGIKAIDGVSIEVHKGDIVGLVGENGAGKSTLMKLLVGEYSRDSGEVFFDGKPVNWNGCSESIKYGVGLIHQKPSLVPELTGAQNIFLGREFTKLGAVDNRKIFTEAKKILNTYPIKKNLDLNKLASQMTAGEREIVDILKVLSFEPRILILDEPSASLTENESKKLMEIIKKLNKEKQVSIIFISHKLEEIFDLCTNVVVLRNGKNAGELPKEKFDKDLIIKMIINKSIGEYYPPKSQSVGKELLALNNVTAEGIKNISLSVKAGEIVGLYGLSGAGMTNILETVFGMHKIENGSIVYGEKSYNNITTKKAIENKVFLIPEDRDKKGLIKSFSVGENITLSHLSQLIKKLVFGKKTETPIIKNGIENFAVKCSSPQQLVGDLSGGNQQKIVIAKWLYKDCSVLMLDDPTVGIDVGTKKEIYQRLRGLANQDKGILLISSEIQEIIGLSDRIYTIRDGMITNEIVGKDIMQEKILENIM